MATSTIPRVFVALSEVLHAITWPSMIGAREDGVYIFDGTPGRIEPENYVCIGGDQRNAASGSQDWAQLGHRQREENYGAGMLVTSYVYGDSTADAFNAAQLAARTNAFVILAAIEDALRADPLLAAVADPPGIVWCGVAGQIKVTQTAADDPEADKGRICTLLFTVQVKARI